MLDEPVHVESYRADWEAVFRLEQSPAKRSAVAAGATTLIAYSRAKRPAVEEILVQALKADG